MQFIYNIDSLCLKNSGITFHGTFFMYLENRWPWCALNYKFWNQHIIVDIKLMPTYILVRLSFPERKVCLVSCSLHVTKYATTPTNYVSSLHPKSKNEGKKKHLLNYSSHSNKFFRVVLCPTEKKRYSQHGKLCIHFLWLHISALIIFYTGK